MLRLLFVGLMACGAWVFAQNGAPAGSSAPGPTQPVPSGAAPVPGASNPSTTPLLPSTSPQPYPMLPNDRAPASVAPPAYDPIFMVPQPNPFPGSEQPPLSQPWPGTSQPSPDQPSQPASPPAVPTR